jgi:hypothetical protein
MTIAKSLSPGGNCKGTLLVHFRAFVLANGDETAWKTLLAESSRADAALLTSQLLVSSWYGVGVWNRALRIYFAKCSDAAGEVRRYADYVAERDLSTVLKLVLSIATPEIIVSRTSMFWRRYFDVGSLAPTKIGPQHWSLTIVGPKGEDEGPAAICCGGGVSSWVEHALRRSGARSPKVTHVRCRFNGAPECVSDVVW